MSMISAQINELRELVGDGSMEWVAGPVRASVLREAADTIWQLRDDLQQANAENAKLRELLKAAWNCIHTGPSCSDCRIIAGGCTLQSAMRELETEV